MKNGIVLKEKKFEKDIKMNKIYTFIIAMILSMIIMTVPSFANNYNILILYYDDLNNWSIGKHPQAITPNFDKLRNQSFDFIDAHTTASVCRPARASVLTGRSPWKLGILGNSDTQGIRGSLLPNTPSLPQLFRRMGYRSFAMGKIDHKAEIKNEWNSHDHYIGRSEETQEIISLGYNRKQKLQNIDGIQDLDWGSFSNMNREKYMDVILRKQAIEKLKYFEQNPSQKWILAVGFRRTHMPLYCPKEDGNNLPDEKNIIVPGSNISRNNDISPKLREWIDGDNNYSLIMDAKKEKSLVRQYLTCVHMLDNLTGDIINHLDSSIFKNNTIVVVLSDHGYHLFTSKKYIGKNTPWIESTHVPFFIRVPNKKGFKINTVVSTGSLIPTLLELNGINRTFDYPSLVPFMNKNQYPSSIDRASTAAFYTKVIHTRRWTLIKDNKGHLELYERNVDLNMILNKANLFPSIARSLEGEINEF